MSKAILIAILVLILGAGFLFHLTLGTVLLGWAIASIVYVAATSTAGESVRKMIGRGRR